VHPGDGSPSGRVLMTGEAIDTYRYRLFGGVLQSDLAIPELEPADAAESASWVLRSRTGEVPGPDGVELGTDTLAAGINIRLYRRADGYRLIFDDTGCFDIAEDGRSI